MSLHDMATVQVDLPSQICCRGRRRISIDVEAGRVITFAIVVEGIKLHGDALRNALISECASDATQGIQARVLDREGKPVRSICRGWSDLEAGVTRKALNVHGRRV